MLTRQIWVVHVDPWGTWEQGEAQVTEGNKECGQGGPHGTRGHGTRPWGLWAGSLEEATRIWNVNREILALALYWVRGWLC